jgi:phosphatidylinositol alpha-mannosyltransferase
MDVYCAPNTGGESFGMVLTEAMAAGTAVLASDLGAFRAVLSAEGDTPEGSAGVGAGVLFPTGDARGLASALAALLDDPQRRAALGAAARTRAAAFDWPVVAADVLRVYRAAIAADPRRVPGRTAAGSR